MKFCTQTSTQTVYNKFDRYPWNTSEYQTCERMNGQTLSPHYAFMSLFLLNFLFQVAIDKNSVRHFYAETYRVSSWTANRSLGYTDRPVWE